LANKCCQIALRLLAINNGTFVIYTHKLQQTLKREKKAKKLCPVSHVAGGQACPALVKWSMVKIQKKSKKESIGLCYSSSQDTGVPGYPTNTQSPCPPTNDIGDTTQLSLAIWQ